MRFIILAAVALGGCVPAKPEMEIVMVAPEPAPAVKPHECNPKSDPKWQRLPDTALRKSDIVRADAANARSFDTISGRRRDCWAVLNAAKG